MKIIIAIVIFSAIILFHELGHFLFAKLNKIVVTEFSLGMGPRLYSFEKGDTRYSLKLLPIGGSCAMVGEDMEDDSENSFNSKGVWARFSVIFANVLSRILKNKYNDSNNFNQDISLCLTIGTGTGSDDGGTERWHLHYRRQDIPSQWQTFRG